MIEDFVKTHLCKLCVILAILVVLYREHYEFYMASSRVCSPYVRKPASEAAEAMQHTPLGGMNFQHEPGASDPNCSKWGTFITVSHRVIR